MMIQSILDTDLYKLSMQQAVLQHYPTAMVTYKFTNRSKSMLFNRLSFDKIQSNLNNLKHLQLTQPELAWLKSTCPYLTESYLDYLVNFRFNPVQQITSSFVPIRIDAEGIAYGELELSIAGKWTETILYEVPIMAIISECYFDSCDTKWDYRGQLALAKEKGHTLFNAGCIVSEFGTRRRRSYLAQSLVLKGLIAASNSPDINNKIPNRGKLAGTSNVHFAMIYDLLPIGTIAHEWIMGIAAAEGYLHSNSRAMDRWTETFPSGVLSVMLTDTFTTAPFFDDFVSNPVRARTWKVSGLRHDSGDPIKFIETAKKAFLAIGSDPSTKVLVFSDGLDVERCLELKRRTDETSMLSSFGIGTFLTNDFKHVEHPIVQSTTPGEGEIQSTLEKSKPLNMVIKLSSINGKFTIKLSDDLGKHTGDVAEIEKAKEVFGLA